MNKLVIRWGFFQKLLRILIVVGVALVLTAFALGFLRVAKTTALAKTIELENSSRMNVLPPNKVQTQQKTDLLSPIFITSPLQINPALSPNQELPVTTLHTVENVHSSSLPGWVVDVISSHNLQASNNDISIVKSVATSLTMGSTGTSSVFNGEGITYTISITNLSSVTLTNLFMTDELPRDALTAISCSGGDSCGIINETFVITNPFSASFFTVQVPRTITAAIASLAPGESTQIEFNGLVACRANGSTFTNQAVLAYEKDGVFLADQSNETATTVQVIPNAEGDFSMSTSSTWCSQEPGGTYDLDWGDFDRDGDLDLVLSLSEGGTVVYRNESGSFSHFWSNNRFSFTARWADVDNDNTPELVVLSSPTNDLFSFQGYIYEPTGGGFNETKPFIVGGAAGLLRLAPADYDLDGDIELVVLSYLSGCGLYFYDNDGAGNFTSDPNNQTCLTSSSVRAMAWGDYDNDGWPDLAAGGFSTDQVFLNNSGVITTANSVSFDTTAGILDLAWGDYDGDGRLDLAAGTNGDDARIYHRLASGGFATPITKFTTAGTGFGVDWGDFNGDGQLDLAVADVETKIYEYEGGTNFSPIVTLPVLTNDSDNEIWRLRGADQDNDGDLELIIGNRNSQIALFTTFAPFSDKIQSIEIVPPDPLNNLSAGSVAWGDVVGDVSGRDGNLDLIFGAGPVNPDPEQSFLKTKLYENVSGTFPKGNVTQFSLLGPQDVAFGDVNSDGELDIALAIPNQQNEIYFNGAFGSTAWHSQESSTSNSLIWLDNDLDNLGRLDLIVGNNGQNHLYFNPSLQTGSSAAEWLSSESDNTQAVAWAYYNNDIFPDFAVGNEGQINQIYLNRNGGKTFELATWTPTISDNTRSVAWGDYDNDGDMDLAIGNYGQPNYIYENQGNMLSATPIWTSTSMNGIPIQNNTTSLAWGDWNNDGYLDLAVGNDGEQDEIYLNAKSIPGMPKFLLLWKSTETYQTSDIAWGDMDNDGDQDLAVSQDGNGKNGVYENTYVLAPHILENNFTKAMPLPQNPSYLSIAQPGAPNQVWSRTAPITDPANLTVPISFRMYDPDYSRQSCEDLDGEQVKVLKYEYSLNDGGTWYNATVSPATTDHIASCTGRLGSVTWQAGTNMQANNPNQPVTDNARFRITIAHLNKTGPSQRASTRAVSPPFRIRNLSCVWPDNAEIIYQAPISSNVSTVFTGTINPSEGQTTFTWDFGDGATVKGQIVQHTFPVGGMYPITLTVTGPACPKIREVVAFTTITVMTGTEGIYLPIIQNTSNGTTISTPSSESEDNTQTSAPQPQLGGPFFVLDYRSGAPVPVVDFNGSIQSGSTVLQWSPNSPDNGVTGYRVYRAPVGTASFQLLADIPASAATYIDDTDTCGQSYFVTAVNTQGESLPSTNSYFSPPCP